MSRPHPSVYLLTALLILFMALFLAHPISMTTADIGRHLKNGAALFETGSIIKTNFYSYTHPSFPALNHHWGSGALFFLVWRLAGFSGLHIFFAALALAAFLTFFFLAKKEAGAGIAGCIAIPAIFLLSERTEVRPEVFSYLFCGVFIWILTIVRERPTSSSLLALLPLIQVLWVNSHIYFFIGPSIIAAFFLDRLVASPRDRRTLAHLGGAFLASIAATLVNPFGIAGAAAPFMIFKNYGYRLAENQPVWFMEQVVRDPNFLIFKIVFAALAASFILRLAKKHGADWGYLLLALGISAMAWLQIRNLALFGLFSLPIISSNIAAVWTSKQRTRHEKKLVGTALAVIVFLLVPAFFGHIQRAVPYWREFGLGLRRGDSAAADFFKKNGLRGPLFNNYDIGGYLIFHLYPEERVFVDNRPEAYPADFFPKTYIPMQENNELWKAADVKYSFNAIFFFWRDMTPWGQQFLISRISDPEWAPVFTDESAIIFLKRNEANTPIIDRYEIPKSSFRISPSS